ncbi:hypothetical protein TRICI_004170 [Trichomonascus ciferrii]|uniref:N-acetyltransferase domain-containing protein n=1 Tax=Trichomonascus ciferrii TaxID=44093 RepID=A0A642V1S7_9ASCO|nr:hypothetical protein TRICI_004170 [Trichomonascus ciferrii]
MSTQKYSIEPVFESDISVIGEMLHTAKLALPINRLLWNDWPNDEAQKPQYLQAAESGLEGSSTESLKAVDKATGEIVGYFVLALKPGVKSPTYADNGPQSVPKSLNPAVLTAVSNASTESSKQIGIEDHFGKFFGHRRRTVLTNSI